MPSAASKAAKKKKKGAAASSRAAAAAAKEAERLRADVAARAALAAALAEAAGHSTEEAAQRFEVLPPLVTPAGSQPWWTAAAAATEGAEEGDFAAPVDESQLVCEVATPEGEVVEVASAAVTGPAPGYNSIMSVYELAKLMAVVETELDAPDNPEDYPLPFPLEELERGGTILPGAPSTMDVALHLLLTGHLNHWRIRRYEATGRITELRVDQLTLPTLPAGHMQTGSMPASFAAAAGRHAGRHAHA